MMFPSLPELHRPQTPFAGEHANVIRVDAKHYGDLFRIQKPSLNRGACNGHGNLLTLEAKPFRFANVPAPHNPP
jgi:hypothetical protein